MVTFLLYFHENVRFTKTLSEDQEHPFTQEKTAIVFLDPTKKFHVIFVGSSWNNQRIFLNSTFADHYLGIFPEIALRTFSEYTGNI